VVGVSPESSFALGVIIRDRQCGCVKQCPEPASVDSVGELSGHVWIQELPTGGTLRFQVSKTGLVTFGVDNLVTETVESLPIQYHRAAQFVTDQLDRAAFRAAVDDPTDVTVCGIASWNEGLEYDWSTVPAFVGMSVWDSSQDRFLSPDASTAAFERLGLPTLPAIDKEVPAKHADLERFDPDTGLPDSAWRSGTAAGVLLRDKSGGRVAAWHSDQSELQTETNRQSATDLADSYATDERIEQTMTGLQDSGESTTVSGVSDQLVADIAREAYAELFPDGTYVTSVDAFQSAVAQRVQQYQLQ